LVILDQTYGKDKNAGGHLDAGQVIEIASKMKRKKLYKCYKWFKRKIRKK
jgi:hypothetical protein